MKRIIFILFVLTSFCAANAQTTYPTFLPSPKGDSALAQYGYVWPKTLLLLPNRDTAIRPKYPSLVYWPHAGVDSTLWIYDMHHWKQVTGSGTGGTVVWGDITGDIHNQTDLINYIDSVVNASAGGSTEYVVQGFGIKVDSALRVYTVRADTVVMASKTWFYNRIDSLILTFNNTYVKYSDTATMLSHYVRRVLAGTNVTVDNTNPQYPIVSATAGGSGTVTSFSSGNLSPLFTTSVATATTTPAQTFALSTATAWRVFSSNASTTPAYNQLKADHLNTTYSNGNMLITDGSGNVSWTTAGISPSDTATMLTPYVRGGVINWPGTIYSTPTTATVSSHVLTFAPTLANQTAYTNFGNNTSSSAAPTFFTNKYTDSLKRSSDSVYCRVNNNWVFQYKDSTGGGSSLDTTTIYNYLEKKKSNSTSVYNKAYWTAGTDFTISGTTPTYNSDGSIRVISISTLEINNTASSEDNFDMSVTYKLSAALSTSSSGLYMGKNGSSYNNYVGVSFANTNNTVVKFYANASLVDSAKIGLIPSTNDVINIRLIKTGSNYRFEYENVTTNEKGSYELRCNLKAVGFGLNFIPANTGNYAVWALGGQMDISSIKVLGNNATNGKIAVIGDSKTALAAGPELLRFPNLLKVKGDVSIWSGPYDATTQVLSEISYIAKHRYKYVVLNIGRNDIIGGVFGVAAQGRYQQIVDSLTAYGTTVIHLLPIPEGSAPALGLQTSLKTWIQTQYSGGLLVDPSTGWANSTMVSADSVHPTSEGNRYVANAILATGYLPALNDSTSAPDPIYISRQADTRYNLGVPLDAVVFGNLAHPAVNASNGAEVAIGWKSQFATILTATLNLNVSVGGGALAANTTGNNNTAIGNGALLSSTTASDNTGVGSSALRTATGTSLTAVGSNAGQGILTGSGVYYGKSTTSATLSATGVVVIGNNAKAGHTNDVIVGDASGGATGQNNVGVGNTVLKNGSGASNTVIGHAATLNTTMNGSQNIGIGFGAIFGNGTTTMANSIAIGAFSTNTQTAGGYNIALGSYVQQASTTGSGQLNIGNVLYGVNLYQTASNSSTPTATGSIGIGLTTPTSQLHTAGSFATGYVSKATSYTATFAEHTLEVTATGQTITLPTAVGIQGRIYTIKLTASGSSTVATTSSQTIDGSTTYSLSAQYKYVTVQSNNANWLIIANN